ncbi:MAG: hypothetical protein HGA99_02335 [Chlorobiaceae bacterium]|nr:hypothetical protein [Chlorobiaceae bacterium]
MDIIYQDDFEEIDGCKESFALHVKASVFTERNLVIFLHGLFGNRYKTWNGFQKYLFDDIENCDIGTYTYLNGFKRVNIFKSKKVEIEGRLVGEYIRDLDYDNIYIIAHSLGGVLCQQAFVELITSRQSTSLKKIKGLFLIAVPLLGSWVIPRLLAFLSYDFELLRVGSKILQKNIVILNNYEDVYSEIKNKTWVIVAANDKFVDQYSASFSIKSSNIKTVDRMHTTITKPNKKNDVTYDFIIKKLNDWIVKGERIGLSVSQLKGMRIVDQKLIFMGELIKKIPKDLPWLYDVENNDVCINDFISKYKDEKVNILISGEPGTGKTVTLIQLYLNERFRKRGVYLDSDSLKKQLMTGGDYKLLNIDRLFIDGLDLVLPDYDEEMVGKFENLIKGIQSVIVTLRPNLLLRADTKKIIMNNFTRSYSLNGIKKENLTKYFDNDRVKSLKINQDKSGRVRPLLVAMFLLSADEMEGIPEENMSNLYERFCYHWMRRESKQSLSDIEYYEIMKALSDIAPAFYKNRYGGKEILKEQGVLSDNKYFEYIKTLLLVTYDDKVYNDFIHPTLTEFFCAYGVYRSLVENGDDEDLKNTVLKYPNQFEVNVFLRSNLLKLRDSEEDFSRVLNKILNALNLSYSNGEGSNSYIYRNNLYYVLGRLPGLKENPEILNDLYQKETHSLPRYTLLMNAVYWDYKLLSDMCYNSVMYPKSNLEKEIMEANLLYHLHYYGDIGSLNLPPNGTREWGLTRNRLVKHFLEEYAIYRPFWLIDLITVTQLTEKYGGNITDIEFMIKSIENKIHNNDCGKETEGFCNEVVKYCKQKVYIR